jgi:hypothetical protein
VKLVDQGHGYEARVTATFNEGPAKRVATITDDRLLLVADVK